MLQIFPHSLFSISSSSHFSSQGVILRDSRGVGDVRALAGNKVLRILKAKGEFSLEEDS